MCKMDYYKLIYFKFILSIKLVSSVPIIDNCHCVPLSKCPVVDNLLKVTLGEAEAQYCDQNMEYVCCDREEEQTIAEKKCEEFAGIEGFCPIGGLIKDGNVTSPNELPFMASVQFKSTGGDFNWACGGALIDPKFVLTAGHCFDIFDDSKMELSVVLGAHNRSGSGIRFMANFSMHPKYGGEDSLADLALLKLHGEANIKTEKIRPVCLPKTDGSEIKEFMTAGWGLFNGSHHPDVLLKATLKQMQIENCRSEERNTDTKRQICTKPISTGDVCRGDSGGPVFAGYPGRDDCLFVILGVISEGNLCDISNKQHTVHTRVSYYREWIEETVWPEETIKKT